MANVRNGGRRSSSLTNGASKKGQFRIDIDGSRLTAASAQLTSSEVAAFYEAFSLFDYNKNGKISYDEFLETLQRVGVSVNEDVVQDLIISQDENGNGELDFEEYLNFMTNEDSFVNLINGLRTPTKPNHKDVLLYEVMTKFISKSCLKDNQRNEIVGYYREKLKTVTKKHNLVHAVHVVHHYADGARSLGLTEKEIFIQMEKIKKIRRNEANEKKKNSPYAQTMRLTLTPTGTQKTNQDNKIQPGWCPRQLVPYGVKLPIVSVDGPLSFDELHTIRQKVKNVLDTYYWLLSKSQQKLYREVWKNLYINDIPSSKLRTMMKEIYRTYTASRLTGCRGKKHGPSKPPIVVPNSSANDS